MFAMEGWGEGGLMIATEGWGEGAQILTRTITFQAEQRKLALKGVFAAFNFTGLHLM